MLDLRKDHTLPDECPHCAEAMDGLEGPADGPSAGDITICMRCAGIAVFTDQMTLRKPTTGELVTLLREPDLQRVVDAIHRLNSDDWVATRGAES